MKKIIPLILLIFALPLHAEPLFYGLSDENGARQIVFTSEAPLEVVEGIAERFSGQVRIDFNTPELVQEAQVRVSVQEMQTGVPLRDTHMKSPEWLSAAQYPSIQFTSSPGREKAKKKGKDTWFLNAHGQFSLKGINQSVTVPLTITRKRRNNKDVLIITGRFTVNLSQHNIRGPAGMRMIGARVSDSVRVSVKLVGVR